MKRCAICGTNLAADLFSAVTQEPVCAICKLKFIGGRQASEQLIWKAREVLGLSDGEFLQQDNAAEAARLLGK